MAVDGVDRADGSGISKLCVIDFVGDNERISNDER